MTSDVTAVVLSMGEDYTTRAIASVAQQTLPVRESILVEGISPFHRAINAAAACVRTDFFIQVDADMVLDAACVVGLRQCVTANVGVVCGHLLDPIRGRVPGVKLFRTRCFERHRYRDVVCQDSEFITDLARDGWVRVDALRYQSASPEGRHVFGTHEPAYTPLYTFSKFVVEGVRSRFHPHQYRFLTLLRQLRGSTHPMVPLAIIGLAYGLFVHAEHDLLKPYVRTRAFEIIERFLCESCSGPPAATQELVSHDVERTFRHAHHLGTYLRREGAGGAFLEQLHQLRLPEDLGSCVALIGLCHGLFQETTNDGATARAWGVFRPLLYP
jgi:hypothetical protein